MNGRDEMVFSKPDTYLSQLQDNIDLARSTGGGFAHRNTLDNKAPVIGASTQRDQQMLVTSDMRLKKLSSNNMS